jgi:hypothetical protein
VNWGSFRSKRKEVEKVKRIQLSMSLLLLAGVMGYTPIAIAAAPSTPAPHQPKGVKPGVIGAVALNREGSYCHLRFPAIRPSTITTAKPTLKPASSNDIIDFYGPCDYDPVGKEEVLRQKQMYDERLDNQYQ